MTSYFPGRGFGFGTGAGVRLFDIPNVPTVMRDPLGRWAPLTEELVYRYKEAAADAINGFANMVANDSLREVPRYMPSVNPEEWSVGELFKVPNELADSIRYPGNDPNKQATPEYMIAGVEYTAPYAGVQHEGFAEMLHEHPIIPGKEGFFEKEDEWAPIDVQWVAKFYSTPGTKNHYLSDPFKAAIPRFESYVGMRVRESLNLF